MPYLSGDVAEGKIGHEPLPVVPLERLTDGLQNSNSGGRCTHTYICGGIATKLGLNQVDPRLEEG